MRKVIFPYYAAVVLRRRYYVFAIVTDVATEDFVIMAFEETDVFACQTVPNSTDSVEPCAQDKVILSVEFDPCNFSLVSFEGVRAGRCVNIVDPDS
jgi:hypothetical protein